MTKNATTFYAKDSLFFRIFTIFLILTIEPLKILWRLHLSFNSTSYYEDPSTILDILYIIITIATVVIFFFPMDKHWKKYAIVFGNWFVASTFYYILEMILSIFVHSRMFHIIRLVIALFFPFIYMVSALFSFLLLTGKKPFKYIYIVGITLASLLPLISISSSFMHLLDKNIFYNPTIKVVLSGFIDILCNNSPIFIAMFVFGFCLKKPKVKNTPVATIPAENHINESTINTADIPVEEVVSVEQQIPVDISPKKVNIENTPTEYIYCAHCGAKGLTNTTFCTKCGQPHIIID